MFFAFLPPLASHSLPQQAFRRLALLSVVLCLSACTGLTPHADGKSAPARDALRSFALDGRFALRHEDKSYSGRLSWRHAEAKEGSDRNEDSDDSDEILLASPLGQGLAEIVSNAGGARLTTSDGRSYAAENAEVLTLRVLGYPLPLGKLADWVRGRSHRGAAGAQVALLEADAIARPLRLREDGWRINYEYDSDDPQALPGRLLIERTGEGGFDLRLRIDEWAPAPREQNSLPKPSEGKTRP